MNKPYLPIDIRSSILYFELSMDYSNLEEDADSDEPEYAERRTLARRMLSGPAYVSSLELEALKHVEKELCGLFAQEDGIFPRKVSNEAHNADGVLLCKMAIQSASEMKKVWDHIIRLAYNDAGIIETPVLYFEYGMFQWHPQGVNAQSYVFADGMTDPSIEEWLKEMGEIDN
jgi:hypothetical protein